MMKRVELTAPAGSWCALRSAIDSGADSVYFGVKGLNMRQGAENFDILEIKKVMNLLHENKKKGYLALNVIIYDNEIKKVTTILKAAAKAKVDGVILWDMAVFAIAKKLRLNIHISTQASVSNFESFKYYAKAGAKRIVMARECTLKDIGKIAQKAKEEKLKCGIECFVHGAMCVSISGRCFLSHHSFGKSANRGECLQPCRRMFSIKDVEKEASYSLGSDYILSPKDLCTIGFLDQMIESDIKAFKIEGRNRPPEYVSEVSTCYRKAIDAYYDKSLVTKLKNALTKRLKKSYNRGFENGFYLGDPAMLGGVVEKNSEKVYLGEVRKFYNKISVAEILIRKGPLNIGDNILVTGKKIPATHCVVREMQIDHKPVMVAEKGMRVGIKFPCKVYPDDKVFLYSCHSEGEIEES
ncbi:MAG: peptidase U32 family protein [Candidatus Orphnella occulta]|nr:peptidase U32 family protein [Candidatus Orphnella occulta]